MRGWVYVISNEAMPGLLKVGFTLKDPQLRAKELEHTGVPHPYVLDYEVMVEGPRNLEKRIHDRLARVREGREWFRCTLPEAVEAIRELVGETAVLENLLRSDVPSQVRPAERVRFCATYSGPCQHCNVQFVVTVTRHESGAVCPTCYQYNELADFVSRELPR